MKQVMVRIPQLHGDTRLVRADVIKENGGALRVQVDGERTPRDVKASEVIPMATLAGGQPVIGPTANPVTMKQYPGRNSLHGIISNRKE